jgi:hypothetical protein
MINYWLDNTDFVETGQAMLSGKNLVGASNILGMGAAYQSFL